MPTSKQIQGLRDFALRAIRAAGTQTARDALGVVLETQFGKEIFNASTDSQVGSRNTRNRDSRGRFVAADSINSGNQLRLFEEAAKTTTKNSNRKTS
jgi:hypothetical protein